VGEGCRRCIGKIMWWTKLHLEVGQLSDILLMSVLRLYRQSRSVRVGRILGCGLVVSIAREGSEPIS